MSEKKDTIFILGNVSDEFPSILNYLESRFRLDDSSFRDLSSGNHSFGCKVFLCSESMGFEGLEKESFGNSSILFILQRSKSFIQTPFIHTRNFLVARDDRDTAEVLEEGLKRALIQCESLDELERSNRQLKTLVYSITHDLRAPLMSLLGLIDISREDDTLDKKEMFKLFERSIGRMDEHIKTTLDYYRNQSEEINYSDIDVPELINGIVDMHRNYNQVVEFDITHKGKQLAHSDPLRVRIAVFNLISNAIKYGNKGIGKYLIKVDSDCSQDHLKISVKDFGPGIHPDDHERIFSQFVLESESSKSTGLGLYLTRDAMHRIGGNVHLKSEPGKGAKFTLDIPLVRNSGPLTS